MAGGGVPLLGRRCRFQAAWRCRRGKAGSADDGFGHAAGIELDWRVEVEPRMDRHRRRSVLRPCLPRPPIESVQLSMTDIARQLRQAVARFTRVPNPWPSTRKRALEPQTKRSISANGCADQTLRPAAFGGEAGYSSGVTRRPTTTDRTSNSIWTTSLRASETQGRLARCWQ